MTDLRERVPAHAVMEKVVTLRGTADLRELPFGMIMASKDGINWVRGVNGELKMAARLEHLGPAWSVLHSVPVGDRGSDIDHIVVGPAGVFTINTKRLLDARVWVAGGRFLVNGSNRQYLRNSVHEAKRVEAVLRNAGIIAPIVPVVAISGSKSLTIKASPAWDDRSIGVTRVDDVVRRIRKRRASLPPAQCARIVELFSDPTTWSRRPAESSPPADVLSAYAIVDRGISRYRLLMIGAATLFGGLVAALGLVAYRVLVSWAGA